MRILRTPTLVVMHPDGIRWVLARSPGVYADPKSKREGMNHFQPGAVTISRGHQWHHRREFNDKVLGYGQPLHRCAGEFLAIIRDEVTGGGGPAPRLREWNDFDEVFARIARQVIFGRRARDDREITDLLRALMRQANRPVGRRRTRHYERFYRKVSAYLGAAMAHEPSLAGLCAATPYDPATRVANQIPHWMFATWETLATNTVRALALVVVHPSVEQRVRREIAAADLSSPAGIEGMKYLGACVQDAMRLWPTTPMILREVIDDDDDPPGGQRLAYGSQVMIPNTLHHRDHERNPDADRFAPDAWLTGPAPNPLYNHLSNGYQPCAGRELGVFLAKAILANLLAQRTYALERPDLDPTKPLPRSFNYFRIRFRQEPIRAAAPTAGGAGAGAAPVPPGGE